MVRSANILKRVLLQSGLVVYLLVWFCNSTCVSVSLSASVSSAVHTGSLKSLVEAGQGGGCGQVGYEGGGKPLKWTLCSF